VVRAVDHVVSTQLLFMSIYIRTIETSPDKRSSNVLGLLPSTCPRLIFGGRILLQGRLIIQGGVVSIPRVLICP
jgi:hypothetical protein